MGSALVALATSLFVEGGARRTAGAPAASAAH